jgi:DNA-binding LacI/PurR family transcriptional regulator
MATISELADQLGVSVATVSRALNDKPGVSPEMRARVLTVATEMNYRPNMAARNLSTSSTSTVLFIVHRRQFPAAVDPFYPYIMHGLEERLSGEGYSVMLVTINDDQLDAGPYALPALQEQRADAVILAGPDITPGFVLATANMGLPTLLVDNALRETPFPSVQADNEGGSRAVTNHLIREHKQKRISLIRGPCGWVSCEERQAGYQAAMVAASLEPHIVQVEDTTLETGIEAARCALEQRKGTTALVAVNDAMAIGAMRAARQLNYEIPGDLVVVGFDNIYWAAYTEPPLTTVSVPTIEVGRLSARLLLEMLGGTLTAASRTTVATRLVIRESCGCSSVH